MTGNLSGAQSGDVFGEPDGAGRGDRASGGLEDVAVRIDSREIGALEQRVADRRHLGAPPGMRTLVVLPSDDHAPQGQLRRVVAQQDLVPGGKITIGSSFRWLDGLAVVLDPNISLHPRRPETYQAMLPLRRRWPVHDRSDDPTVPRAVVPWDFPPFR